MVLELLALLCIQGAAEPTPDSTNESETESGESGESGIESGAQSESGSRVEVLGPRVARASAAGVTLTVETIPPDPTDPNRPTLATLVRVENRGSRTLAMDYDRFTLVLPRTSAPGLPAAPDGSGEAEVFDRPVSQPVPRSIAEVPTAPAPWHRSTDVWTGPFSSGPFGQREEMGAQTPDAPERWVRPSLPERPTRPGRGAEGFLFFQNAGDAFERFELRYDLVDARTEERLGEIRVPLLASP